MKEIHAEGQITPRDMKQAFRLLRRARRKAIRSQSLFWTVDAAAAALLLFSKDYLALSLYAAFFAGVFAVAISLHLKAARRRKQSPLLQDTIEYDINDNVLETRQPLYATSTLWAAFLDVHDTPDLLILRISELQMLIFPRHFFASDQDWQAFAVEARRRVGKCRRCDYPLKGSVSDTCPECGASLASGGQHGRKDQPSPSVPSPASPPSG